jgi:protein-disulfide isomerase
MRGRLTRLAGVVAAVLALSLPLLGCGGGALKSAAAETPPHDNVLTPGPLGDHAMGRPNAPVTVIEYASWSCPHCRNFEMKVFPRFKRAFIDTGKVRYVVREFPIGHASGTAALVNNCAPKGKYFILFHDFLADQADWVSQEVRLDAIYGVARRVGMSRAAFDKCLANQPMIAALKAVKERGRQLGIIGTPTFFINGQKAQGEITFEQLKAMIESKAPPPAGNA